MRTNGFEKPFNGMQISTWVLLPLLPIQFLTFLTPSLPSSISAPITVVYLITAAIATYFGYTTTKTDSIDPLLHQHHYGCPHPRIVIGNNVFDIGETKYCWVCQTNVGVKSMHCKYCDKCVSHFDHHCAWLNTCVGSANYKTFFQTVIWTFVFITMHVATLVLYLCLFFADNAEVGSLASSWWGGAEAEIILVGFNIGFLVFTSFCSFMVLQLLVFHLGLRREKITTYEYIVRDSARKRERVMLTHKIRQRRVQELQTAGNSVEAICLKAGAIRCFQRCDPVRSLVLSEVENSSVAPSGSRGVAIGLDDDLEDSSDSDANANANTKSTKNVEGNNGINNDAHKEATSGKTNGKEMDLQNSKSTTHGSPSQNNKTAADDKCLSEIALCSGSDVDAPVLESALAPALDNKKSSSAPIFIKVSATPEQIEDHEMKSESMEQPSLLVDRSREDTSILQESSDEESFGNVSYSSSFRGPRELEDFLA